MPAPDSEIVRIMIAASMIPNPEPPNCSGIQIPSQPASAKGLVKIVREASFTIFGQPICIVEPRANSADGVADRFLLRGE